MLARRLERVHAARAIHLFVPVRQSLTTVDGTQLDWNPRKLKAEKLDPSKRLSLFHKTYWHKNLRSLLSEHEGDPILHVSLFGRRLKEILIGPEYEKIWENATEFCNGASVFATPSDTPALNDDDAEANPNGDGEDDQDNLLDCASDEKTSPDGDTPAWNSSRVTHGKSPSILGDKVNSV